jgi:hypothetical protein
MPRSKPVLKTKQIYPQHQNSHDNPQMEIVIQQMVEIHTAMMRVITQYTDNCDSKELPRGMQQVLDNHSQMIQMIPEMLAVANNNLPQNHFGSKEPRGDAEITLLACESCEEIGHTSKECHEQCPYCDTSHPTGECPMAQLTCFLCDGINHVPTECKFYSIVQRMNQQAKDGLCQLPEKTPKDRRSKMKVEKKVMETAHNITTKSCFSCEEEGHLSRNCSRKRERHPTAEVEYKENEVRDLLAFKRPNRKKEKKDNSKVLCLNCKKLGHYAKKCPERNNKVNRQRRTDLVTCQKCNQKGHYASRCVEKSTLKLQ